VPFGHDSEVRSISTSAKHTGNVLVTQFLDVSHLRRSFLEFAQGFSKQRVEEQGQTHKCADQQNIPAISSMSMSSILTDTSWSPKVPRYSEPHAFFEILSPRVTSLNSKSAAPFVAHP
jgi:hypothetical protein